MSRKYNKRCCNTANISEFYETEIFPPLSDYGSSEISRDYVHVCACVRACVCVCVYVCVSYIGTHPRLSTYGVEIIYCPELSFVEHEIIPWKGCILTLSLIRTDVTFIHLVSSVFPKRTVFIMAEENAQLAVKRPTYTLETTRPTISNTVPLSLNEVIHCYAQPFQVSKHRVYALK
jgi:hypothetical protein